MKQYKAFGPDAEVLGAAMMAFIESINYTSFSHILERHGLDQIYPDHWYPQWTSSVILPIGSPGTRVYITWKARTPRQAFR